MMCARCVSAVRTEMYSCFAISWFVWPSARSRSTSRSRSESGSSAARRASSASAAIRRAPSSGWTYRPPRRDLADRRHHLRVRGLLQDVTARAGGERRRTYCGSSCIDRTSTFALGCSCRSVGSASSPLSSGMTTSSRITSGFSDRASKIASRALPASPTTRDRLRRRRAGCSPDRTTAWSSTISTRIVMCRHLDDERRSQSRPRTRSRACRRGARGARACRGDRCRRRRVPGVESRRRRPRSTTATPVALARAGRCSRCCACACLTTFVSDSCTIRYSAVSTSARQSLLAEPRLELDVDARSVRRTSPSAVRAPARGRSRRAPSASSTASRRTSCSVVTTSSRRPARPSRARRCRACLRAPSARAGSTSTPGRSRRAARVRAGAARAPAPSTTRVAHRAPRARERSTATAARDREGLCEAQVVVGEACVVGAELVVNREHADRAVSHDERHPEPGPRPDSSRHAPGSPRDRRAPSRPARSGAARARDRSSSSSAGESSRRRRLVAPVSRGRAANRSSSSPPGSAIATNRALEQLAQVAARSGRAGARGRSRSARAFPISFSDSSWRDQRVAAS